MPAPTLSGEVTVKRATIFKLGAFGYQKTEARDVVAGRADRYAQYQNVPYVSFVPKGKRKRRAFYDAYDPTTVILTGWNLDLSPASPLTEPVREGNVVTQRSRYGSFDPRYREEFVARLDKWLAENEDKLVVDFRRKETV